jgi:N-acetylmuramoyl-L-alanine amidase
MFLAVTLSAVLHAEAPPAEAVASTTLTTLRAVRRDDLPEAVRITVELDREVPFDQGQLENPPRLFFDLKGTQTLPTLVDAVFKYGNTIVRDVRVGRHPNKTTRIVVDLQGVARYSVYTLYSPYRLVIDCERGTLESAEAPAKNRDVPPTAPASPASNSDGKFSVARQLGLGVSRIVIDAGHGGRDPGAMAFGLSESTLVLDIALRLEALLRQRAGFETVLTRRTDDYVTLEERTDIANRESADLFLSIHANASANATTGGVETYFLNFALNRQAEAVAARENAASGRTMNSLPGIIKAITLNSKVNESRDFAGLVQRSMVRGLRPANKTLKDRDFIRH